MIQHTTRLLVVGGSGFIGRSVVDHAIGLGWDVTNLSLEQPPAGRVKVQRVRNVVADIVDGGSLRAALDGGSFEYVVNCSGFIDHSLFFCGGRKTLNTHFCGLLNLVDALNRDVLKTFVNIGSSDEYGAAPAPQMETQREAPISPYSLGKVASTHFLQMLHRTENFPSVTLRLFLTYGPGQDSRRFLPQIIKGCLEGRPFPTSAGQQLRDFCFIQDTVYAIFAALTSAAARGEVLNVGSGNPVSIRQMIETVRRLIGGGAPQFGEIAYRSGENMELYADISKAMLLLGWKPRVSLEDGLRETIQWIRRQP